MKNVNLTKLIVSVTMFAAAVFFLGATAFAVVPESRSKEKPDLKSKQQQQPHAGLTKDVDGKIRKLPEGRKKQYDPGSVIVILKDGKSEEDLKKTVLAAKVATKKVERVCKLDSAKTKLAKAKGKKPKDISDKEALAGMSAGQRKVYNTFKVDIAPKSGKSAFKEPAKKAISRLKDPDLSDALPTDPVQSAIDMLKDEKYADVVEYVQPNYIYTAAVFPNSPPDDPRYPEQWSHVNMRSVDAWRVWGSGSHTEAIVAIIDTGVDYNHEDLAANMWHNPKEIPGNGIDDDGNGIVDDYYGADFINNDGDPLDDEGHGTHCAGIAGAVTDNGKGIAGVCPSAKIMAVKFLGSDGAGTTAGAVVAINYAAANGAKVISNSWDSGYPDQALELAINNAYNSGCFIVAAAGNGWGDWVGYPAAYKNVFAVAAIDSANNMADFSCWGAEVDVAAPGVDILSTIPGNAYDSWSGTSMACPQVAGQAALLLSKHPTYTPARIANMIRSGANPDIISGEYIGTGRTDLNSAFSQDSPYFETLAVRITHPYLYGMRNIGNILGKSTGRGYTLSYATEPYSDPASWTEFGNGRFASGGPLGDLRSTDLGPGYYFIKLTATDTAGYRVSHTNKVYYFKDDKLLPGWPQEMNLSFAENYPAYMSPVCADFDNDGDKEIFAMDYSDRPYAYLWNVDGTSVDPMIWPKDLWGPDALNGGRFYTTPAAADLDNDGDLELVFTGESANYDYIKIFAWHHDGTMASGWPRAINREGDTGKLLTKNIAIGDVNGDGQPEVALITHEVGADIVKVFVFDKNGNILSGNPGWPFRESCRSFQHPYGPWAVGNPTLADINHDGRDEVIFIYNRYRGGKEGVCYGDSAVNALDAQGAQLTGWPKFIYNDDGDLWGGANVTVGDLNADGNLELFFVRLDGTIYGLDKDGNMLPGWPQGVSSPPSGISLADLDNDGDLEILHLANWGCLCIFHHTGAYFGKGAHRHYDFLDIGHQGVYNRDIDLFPAPVVGDIDGDGVKEVILRPSSYYGELWAVEAGSGNVKPGFPRFMEDECGWSYINPTIARTTPLLDDVDNDGKTEVVAIDNAHKLWVWRLGTNPSPLDIEWPGFGHNLKRTYFYSSPKVPFIDSISPSIGPAGTTVTLRGKGFGEYFPIFSSVLMREYPGEGTYTPWYADSWGNERISFTIPGPLNILSDREVRLKVARYNPATGSNVPSNTAIFNLRNPPLITDIRPASGTPGTRVTIIGYCFGATQPVQGLDLFGAYHNYITADPWTPTSIEFIVPDLPTGNYTLYLDNGNNRSSRQFYIDNKPVITSMPTQGAIGSVLQISGVRFGSATNASSVKFNDTGYGYTSWTPTLITLNVPSLTPGLTYKVKVSKDFLYPGMESDPKSFEVLSAPRLRIAPVSPRTTTKVRTR